MNDVFRKHYEVAAKNTQDFIEELRNTAEKKIIEIEARKA